MNVAGALDLTGEADLDFAVKTFKRMAASFKSMGINVSRPIVLVIEKMPIMGATEPSDGVFRLHMGLQAVTSGMLDGLMAHEVGHMFLMERGHPSHAMAIHQRLLDSITIKGKEKEGFHSVARLAFNHAEDVYADDLAFEVIGNGRARSFFSDWVRRSSVNRGGRWDVVANEVTVAFGLGNMERHGIQPEEIVVLETLEFAKRAQLHHLPELIADFRDLPKTDDSDVVENAIHELLIDIRDEGTGR